MNGKKEAVMQRLHQDIKTVSGMGYKVFGVFLQGSQNYNLDYDGSDIDTKCIVLPTMEDIILNRKPVSTTHVNPDSTHTDIKDIRLMWECFKKQNINFLEILFTDYYIVSAHYQAYWTTMRNHAEDIAHFNNYAAVNCIAGMVFEKDKALCHPYPTLKDKIDKYGYDHKQLHHIIRCEEFLERYISGVPYKECLIPTQPEHLIEVKSTYKYSLEEAKHIAKTTVERVRVIKEKYMNENLLCINSRAQELMQSVLVDVLKQSFLEDLNVV